MIIFTDGSTRIRNKKGALNQGGYGVVVYENNIIIDAFGKQVKNTTNNRMELTAIKEALKRYGTSPDNWDAPTIYTDSSYCVMSLTKWIHTWKADNWIRPGGKPVENEDLMKELYELLYVKDRFGHITKCSGHSGIVGNELADKIATGEMTPVEVYFSDVENNIPNYGYYITEKKYIPNVNYKDVPDYWVTGIEDGWIVPDKALWEWYIDYKSQKLQNEEK